jgi:hypothetical protein
MRCFAAALSGVTPAWGEDKPLSAIDWLSDTVTTPAGA